MTYTLSYTGISGLTVSKRFDTKKEADDAARLKRKCRWAGYKHIKVYRTPPERHQS